MRGGDGSPLADKKHMRLKAVVKYRTKRLYQKGAGPAQRKEQKERD